MVSIKQNFQQIRLQIKQAETAATREPGKVMLLAVSKTKPVTDIATAYQLGQRHFGESYCQEALKKQQLLGAYDITWHFIGPIQSNKTKAIAEHFSWVHSVDRLKIAKRLSQQRPSALAPLNICIQVNISGEPSKSGIILTALADLIAEVKRLDNIRLRGIMAVPKPGTNFRQQCQPYKQLYQTVKQLDTNEELDSFSFGMSGDLKAAIAEGSTIVRIGSGLFGKRA